MKLFLLRPMFEDGGAWDPWYDKAFGFVVRAETAEEARRIANENGGDETGQMDEHPYRVGGDPWLDATESSCVELSADGESEMILRDLRSA